MPPLGKYKGKGVICRRWRNSVAVGGLTDPADLGPLHQGEGVGWGGAEGAELGAPGSLVLVLLRLSARGFALG